MLYNLRLSRSLAVGLLFFVACFDSPAQSSHYMFDRVSPSQSHIDFRNDLTDSVYLSAGTYIYIANGSGTGVADLNNDGKPDIFFSSNLNENKLYLNEGGFKFRDITAEAGITGNHKFGTGVCIADINGDGLLDIYISHSGNSKDPMDLQNEAYICTGIGANGVPHYVDRAKEYGLNLPGTQTTQVVFFDYDRDGDLDCFVLNHSRNGDGERLISSNYKEDTTKGFIGYNLLLKNDMVNGVPHFTDVSKKAGIVNSRYNFGLGVVVGDFNNDGWPDLYCTSDFAERDFLYINNQNGSFTESCEKSMRHISDYSMGVDAADFNNDLKPDIITVDMLPHDNLHLKMEQQPDNNDQFDMMVKLGLQFQYRKNCLQMNMGSINGMPMFSDVAEMDGVNATGWSWTPLFIDVNNDGWKDLFISDGYYIDYTNQDKQNKFITRTENMKFGPKKLPSCLFINNKKLGFTEMKPWKQEDPQMSYSSCAADFDGDGKLDLLINNLNGGITLLKNIVDSSGSFINVKLRGDGFNPFALGAKVFITCNGLTQMEEMVNVRGYESSQDYTLHFGIGNTNSQVTIKVIWPDGTVTVQTSDPGKTVDVIKGDAKKPAIAEKSPRSEYAFTSVNPFGNENVVHTENKYNDLKVQFTIPYKQSQSGPAVADGDINGDGYMDYYVGGSTGNEKYFLLGQQDGSFKKYMPKAFSDDIRFEDVAAAIVDIDGDGNSDLVVVSGGVEHGENPDYLEDRLYKNDGKGNFVRIPGAFPKTNVVKSCIAIGDMNQDGKPDIFIGGYTIAGKFAKTPRSFLYLNNSEPDKISMPDVTSSALPAGAELGMVTSASWVKMDNDKYPSLAICGEWMPCKIFKNKNGVLTEKKDIGYQKNGLYELIEPADYNGDGKPDFIIGNYGNNNHFRASEDQPMNIYDIRDTSNVAIRGFLFSYWIDSQEVFSSSRGEMFQQFVQFRKFFPDFMSYGMVDVKQFFDRVGIPQPRPVKTATNLLSGVLVNDGKDKFSFQPFPDIMQISRIAAVAKVDWNFDGKPDYVIAGNYLGNKHQFGASDGLPVLILESQSSGKYRVVTPDESGLFVQGQVKQISVQQSSTKCRLLIFRNNDKVLVFENQKK